jgi:hypothetical protein
VSVLCVGPTFFDTPKLCRDHTLKISAIVHHGCKKHTLAGVKLQFVPVTALGLGQHDNSDWCNKSHKLQPSDLVLNIWPELQGFHWTASLLAEVCEWQIAEGGSLTPLVP